MSLSGITFGGLSSGIDTESIISRLAQIEAQPLNRLQQQKNLLTQRQSVTGQLKSLVTQLSSSAGQLNGLLAFNPISATISKTEVASISAGPGTNPGKFELEVSALARTHKVASASQNDSTTALGLSGTAFIAGKQFTVETTDSLTAIAQKINQLNTGVVASLLNTGTGTSYMTLTSAASGLANKVQASGSVLETLGVLSGPPAIREAITNGATSSAFTANTTAMGTLLGATGLTDQTIQINSVDVTLNLGTMNLDQVASAINAASTGATATVRTVTSGTNTTYKLDISGATPPTFADAGGTLESLGVLQRGYGNPLVAAADASYKLDGMSLTSSSNTITTVIPGATLSLLKANATTPETATLTLEKDNSQIRDRVKKLVDAFNDVTGYIREASKFDPKTFDTGPLFGDSAARQIETSISQALFSRVDGLTGTYQNANSLGLRLDREGKLNLDESTLMKALNERPAEVEAIFRTLGSSSTSAISFVSITSKTVPTGAVPYQVSISKLASKTSAVAGLAQTDPNDTAERLRFEGALFGGAPVDVDFAIGSTLSEKVSVINGNSRLKDQVIASIDGGKLRIDGAKYGTPGRFVVTSNVEASAMNSGIGFTGTVVTNGADVEGMILGKKATGSGQFLTGAVPEDNSANLALGLQIQYTGTALGDVGTVKVTKGLGAVLSDLLATFTDTANGVFKGGEDATNAQIKNLDDNIQRLTERIAQRQTDLRRRFAAMEQAIAQSQAQSQRLSALNARPSS